ncbi:MAG TPA: TonB-dependent receptor, partial [Ignavibacteria bacterium]|nr:TonB-dependent receptor [Ignavibacteria bacterium]
MKIFLTLIILLSIVSISSAQDVIKGKVRVQENNDRAPVKGAIVKWIGSTTSTETGSEGEFELLRDGVTDERLVVSYTGYVWDTVSAKDKKFVFVTLQPYYTDEIMVEGKKKTNIISNDVGLTETMHQGELEKAACCDLSGCFGTNSSVEVKVTDAVTKTKEIKLLGVNGSYTQVLVDNIPMMTGLTRKYGVSSIPGPLVNSIMISKGSNSVLQGYESISGIINVILKDRETSDKLYLNGFVNDVLEKQFNVNYGDEFGKWNTLVSGHTVQKSDRVDNNGDGFMDNPLTTRYLIYNKWKYDGSETDGFDISWKYLNEEKTGGQIGFNREANLGGSSVYGQTADIEQFEFYSRGTTKLSNSLNLKGVISAGRYDENSYFGYTDYRGKQTNFYVSAYSEIALSKDSELRLGGSYRYEDINEDIRFLQNTNKTYAGAYSKKESIPGIYAENMYRLADNKLELLTGARLDHHNEHGFFVTPRALVKYELSPSTIIRGSVGTGFRTMNLFSEYSGILATSRDIIISEELEPEKALNFGVNLVQYYQLDDVSGSLVVDFYRTNFTNQVIPDYDSDPSKVTFENLNGDSYSNILQAEGSINFLKNFDAKLSYKYSDVRYTQNGIEREYPFVAKHNVLGSISYSPDDGSWNADVIAEWFGSKRLPSTESNPEQYQMPGESEPYTLLNLQ